jgi:hypothetical protein
MTTEEVPINTAVSQILSQVRGFSRKDQIRVLAEIIHLLYASHLSNNDQLLLLAELTDAIGRSLSSNVTSAPE